MEGMSTRIELGVHRVTEPCSRKVGFWRGKGHPFCRMDSAKGRFWTGPGLCCRGFLMFALEVLKGQSTHATASLSRGLPKESTPRGMVSGREC